MAGRKMSHGFRCIEERYIDHDVLALLLANAYDYTEASEFDYDVAKKVVDYIATCSKQGQVAHYAAAGMLPAEIGRQLGMSHSSIKRALEEPSTELANT